MSEIQSKSCTKTDWQRERGEDKISMMANLGVIDADPSEPPSDEEVIRLANRLLSEFNIPTTIEDIGDICAALFVLLYENLFSDRLSGIIRHPASKEDEIHNCQSVIDVLSSDIVRDSLSHIRGVDIVNGDITAISNLLDIFSYLLDYVANRIESDIATDNEDAKSLTTAEQESYLSSDTKGVKSKRHQVTAHPRGSRSTCSRSSKSIQNSLRDAKGKSGRSRPDLNVNGNHSADVSYEKYSALNKHKIHVLPDARGDSYEMPLDSLELPPSPIRPDQSQSLLGQKTVDSTELDLQFGKDDKESSKGSPSPKVAWDDKSKNFERLELKEGDLNTAIGGVISSTTTGLPLPVTDSAAATIHDLELETDLRPRDDKIPYLSASMPPPRPSREEEKEAPFRSTVGPIDYHSPPQIPERSHSDRNSAPNLVKGLSSSYNDLRHLVERTAAMTRVAIQTSPIHGRAQRELNLSDDIDRPRPTIPSDGVRLARELNAREMKRGESHKSSPSRNTKKVAFSSYTSDLSSRSPPHRHPLEDLNDNYFRDSRTTGDVYDRRAQQRDLLGYGYEDAEHRLYNGQPKTSPERRKKTKNGLSKTEAFAQHLAHSRQPELGAAHLKLKTEDRAIKKRQDFLDKMYLKELGEFSEDVHSILNKDDKASQDKEKEMLKSYQESKPLVNGSKKTKSNSKTVSNKKPKVGNRVVSSKAKRSSPRPSKRSTSAPMKLESEEDIIHFLINEFPHLQLSDHTWHELCRKGLHQIETVTRVYQESQRKKSRAEMQLEEAAKRHELLSDIMKKELDHTKRVREMKEKRVHQLQIKNKTHEKRTQSARARRYYNEYQVRARSKQLKRSTREEMVFKDLFRDAMKIQKERIKDIRQYATDQRKCQEVRRQNEMESMENFYQDQFQMLAEKLAKERRDNCVRDKAQHEMVERVKQELRKKIESEICMYQEQMFRDDDDAHFRQMDADRVKRELHMARYAAQI